MSNYFAYIREYYVGTRYIGYDIIDEPDRETFGYYGKRSHVDLQDVKIVTGRKTAKTIPAGTEYITFLRPLSGKE